MQNPSSSIFRFRSAARIRFNGEDRVSRIREAIDDAIASATSEMARVASRLDQLRRQASMCMDADSLLDSNRELTDVRLISTLESRLMADEQQLARLRQQLTDLRCVQTFLHKLSASPPSYLPP